MLSPNAMKPGFEPNRSTLAVSKSPVSNMNKVMPIPVVTQSADQTTMNTMDNKPYQSTVVQTSKNSQPIIPASHALTSNSGSGNTVVPDVMSPWKVQPLYREAVLKPVTMSKESSQSKGDRASETLTIPSLSASAVKPNTTEMAISQTVTTFFSSANAGTSDFMTTHGANWSPIIAAQLNQGSQSHVSASQALSATSNMSVLSPVNISTPHVLLTQSKVNSKSHNLLMPTAVKDHPLILSPLDNSATAYQMTSYHPSGNKVIDIGPPYSVPPVTSPTIVKKLNSSQLANLAPAMVGISEQKIHFPQSRLSPRQGLPWDRQPSTLKKGQINADAVPQSFSPSVQKRQKGEGANADGSMMVSSSSGPLMPSDHLGMLKAMVSHIPSSTVTEPSNVKPNNVIAHTLIPVPSSSSTSIPNSPATVCPHGYNLPSQNIKIAAHASPILANKSAPAPMNVETVPPDRVVTLPPQGRSPMIPLYLLTPPKREGPVMPNTGVKIQRNTGMPVVMPISAEPLPRTVEHNSDMPVDKNLLVLHSNMGDPSALQAMKKRSESRDIQKTMKEVKDQYNKGALSESSQSVSSSSGQSTMNNQVRVTELSQTTKRTPAKCKTLHDPCTGPSVAPVTDPSGMVDAGPSTKPPRTLDTKIQNSTILAEEISPQSQARPYKGNGQQVMSEDVITPDILVQNTTVESGTVIEGSKKTAEMPDSAVYKASLLSGCSLKISRLEDGNSVFPKRAKRKKSSRARRVHKQGKCHCALRKLYHKCKGHRPSQKSTNQFLKPGMEYGGMVPTSKSIILDHMVVDDEHCIQQLISSGRIDNQGRVRNIDHSALQSCESAYLVKSDASLSEGRSVQLSCIDSDITDVAFIDAGKEVQPSFVRKMIANNGTSSPADIQRSVSFGVVDDKDRVRNAACVALQRPEAKNSARIGASTNDVENQVQNSDIGNLNLSEGTYCSVQLRLESLDSVGIDDSLQDEENMLIPVKCRYIGKMIPSEVIPVSVDQDVKGEVEPMAVDKGDTCNGLVYLDFAESDYEDPLIHYPSVRNFIDLNKEGGTTVIKPNEVAYGEEAGYHIHRTEILARSVIHITSTEPEPPGMMEEETKFPRNVNLMAPLQKGTITKGHTSGRKELEKLHDFLSELNKAEVIPSEIKSFLLSLMKSMDSLQETIINLEEAQRLSQQTKPLHSFDTNRAGWSNVQKVISRHWHLLLQVNQTSSSMLQHLLEQAHHVWLKDVSNQDKAADMEESSSSELGTHDDEDNKDVGLLQNALVLLQDSQGNSEKQKKNSQGILRQEYSKLRRELHLAACLSPAGKVKKDDCKAPEKSESKRHGNRIPPRNDCYANLINIKLNQENDSEDAGRETNILLDSNGTSIKPIAGIENKSKEPKHLSPVKKSSTSKSSSTFLKMHSHKHHRRPGSAKRRSEEALQILRNGKNCFPVKVNEINGNSDKFSSNKRQKGGSPPANEMYAGIRGGNHKKGHNSDGSPYNKLENFQKQGSQSSNDGHPSQVKRRLSDPEKEAPPNKSSRTKSSRKEGCTTIRDVSLMTQKRKPSQQPSSVETKSMSGSYISKKSDSKPLIRQISQENELLNKCGKQFEMEVSEVNELRSHATGTTSSTTVAYDLSEEQLEERDLEDEFTVIHANIERESLDTRVDDRKRIIKELERLGRIQQSLSKRSNEIIKMYENIEDNREKLTCEPFKDTPTNQNCKQLKDISKEKKRHWNKESKQSQCNQRDNKNIEQCQGNHNTEQEKEIGKRKETSDRMQSKDKVSKASGIIGSQVQRLSEVKSSRVRLTAISPLIPNKGGTERKHKGNLEKKSAQTKKSYHSSSRQSTSGIQNESPNAAFLQTLPDRGNKQKGHGRVHKKSSPYSRKQYEQGKPEVRTQKFEKKPVHHKKKLAQGQSGASKSGLQQESVKKTCDDDRLYHGKTGASDIGIKRRCTNKHNRKIEVTDTKTAIRDNGSHSKRMNCSDTHFSEKSQDGHDSDPTRKHKRQNLCYQFVNRQEWKGKGSTDTNCTKSGNHPDKALGKSKEVNKVQMTKKAPENKHSGNRGSPKEAITSGKRRGLWQREECISIVNAVYNLEPYSEPFRSEVDSSKIPDYYQIVKLPISLDCVAFRIRNCHYEDVYHFVSDMRRIFWNCRLYNESGQQFIPHCAEAQIYFEKKLRKAFPKMSFKGVSGEPILRNLFN